MKTHKDTLLPDLARLGLILAMLVSALGTLAVPAVTVHAEAGHLSVAKGGQPDAVWAPLAGDPNAMALALVENPAWVTGSSFQTTPAAAASNAFNTPLTFFPTGSDSDYVALSSGDTGSIPVPASFANTGWGGGNIRGDSDYDVTIWEIGLNVPGGVDCLRVDFQFMSEEYPDYVGGPVNDAFIAEWDVSDWTTSGSVISAPHNFAFDSLGNPISINSVVGMSAANGAGTAFDGQSPDTNGGATSLLTAFTPATAGSHTVYFSIFDQGDDIYDSAVFLDNLVLFDSGGHCEAGAVELDYGDAPDPNYPTLLASNGARHTIVAGFHLGAGVDSEADGQPDATATGDDTGGNDDEDGVTFTSALNPGAAATADVVASAAGVLNAWIDFNGNGSWADAGEQIFTDTPLVGGVNGLGFAVPPGATLGTTFARFRFSSAPGLSYDGAADDGEVEDYQVNIEEVVELDFGDAPDPTYPTLLANNGARHTILAGFHLGAGVDSEADGQPDATATGDDVLDGNDDEDGVTFTSVLTAGNPATVDVVASAPGVLNAWIDFNGNGSWADAGEQIFTNTPLVAGVNSLGFVVPGGATVGTTYARFRFSSATGLSYIGAADDGEVEDYQVSIEEAGDHPPELSVSGTVTYTEDNPPLLIAPGLTLTDPEYDPLDGATVAIGDNFSSAQDRLGIGGAESGSLGGISWSYDTGTGILALTGTETITNYESILQQATYLNNSQDPSTAARLVNFSIASGLYFPDNGHFYEFVTSPAIWWANALAGAAARDIYGMQGYLATITSAEENAFIAGKLQGQGWMGASDAGHDKQWYWETGPEAGTWFFTQNGYNPSGPNWCGTGGAVVPGHYANWLFGEPNDWSDGCAGREDYGHYYTNGLWNDYAYNNPAIEGYVVEYGGMPGDPVLSLTGVVTVNVVSVNDAPVAVDDSGVGLTTDEDTAFITGDVLSNDSDVENDPLSIAGFDTTGTAGLVTNNGDGTFGYDPNGQFEWLAVGEVAYDTFTYVVSDSVLTDTATVTITISGINNAPVANDDSGVGFTTDEETAFTTGSVLTNDTDPDTSDTLGVHSFDTTGTTGLVTNNGNGTFDYDPNGQFEYLAVGEQATDVFTYTVTDSNGGFDTATVTITVNGVNDAPTANDDGYTTDEDTPFTTGSVLTNDTDPDTSDTLSVDSFDDSSTLGLVTNNGDGTFGYDPNGQFEYLAVGEQATDVFTYTVTDSNGGFDTAAVTITVNGVNDAPVANDDSGAGFITDEDTPFTTGSVLDNDTDAENDPLSVDSFDDSSTLGLVTGGSGGTFDYDPNAQFEWLAVGEVAYDTFQYTVSDGVLTDTATVTITINGVNDAPTISDIPDQTTSSNTPVGPTGFTVGDVDTPAASLTLSAESSNTTLVPLSNITFGGSGASRTVTVTPTGTLVDETVTITVTVDDGMDTDSDTFTLTVEPFRIHLPLVMKNYVVAPDLVVEDIIATSNDVQVVIKNQGNAPTTEGFWVDVYINPSPIPTGVNQTWDMLGDEGLIWGVAVTLQPGEVITLTIGDQYYYPQLSHVLWPLAVGTPIYAQVDSFNPATTYGTVRESHEMTGGPYNNITGDTVQAD